MLTVLCDLCGLQPSDFSSNSHMMLPSFSALYQQEPIRVGKCSDKTISVQNSPLVQDPLFGM